MLMIRCPWLLSPMLSRPLAQVLLLLSLLVGGQTPLLTASEQEPPKPFPRMAVAIGELVNRFYYDHQRIDPPVMLERALRALESAEISVRAIHEDKVVTLMAKDREVVVGAPVPGNVREVMRILDALGEQFEPLGFSPNRSRELTYQMLNGALMTLDPHTVIMPPRRATAFSEDIAGEFFGVGAYLNQDLGLIRIERVMPGLPAEQAGIQDGDIILAVDGEPTVGLSLPQTVSRIRGPKGTTVVLTVEREGSDQPIDIPTVRDLVEPPTLVSWRHDDDHAAGGIGYVRLDEFNRNSNRQLFMALNGLLTDGDLRGLVLDLRFNGGGLLRQAHMIADMFLSHSREVVRTVSLGRPPQILQSGRNVILEGVPMVVLVGPGSASASEILAGALQHNERAVVAGATTYGKGSVQTVRPLIDDSNLKFTIQEYQLKDGVSIQGQGVMPDLALRRRSVDEDGSVDLVPYSPSTEADLEFALHAHEETAEQHPPLVLSWLSTHQSDDELRQHRISSRSFRPDQEAALIIDLLATATASAAGGERVAQAQLDDTMRTVTKDLLAEAVAARSLQEDARLAEMLAALDKPVAWGADTPVDPAALTITYDGPTTVVPGDDAALGFRIHNASDAAIGRIYGLVRADTASPLWEAELIVGEVPAATEIAVSLPFAVPERLYAGHEAFVLELRQDGRLEPIIELPVAIAIDTRPRPQFSWQWSVREVDGESAVPVLPDAERELFVRISNDGSGSSLPLMVYVFKDDDPFVSLSEGRFSLPALEPGAQATVRVPFQVASEPPSGYSQRSLPDQVSLQIHGEEDLPRGSDGRYRERFFHTLTLPVAAAAAAEGLSGQVTKPLVELLSLEYQESQARLRLRVEDDNLKYLAVFEGRMKTHLAGYGGAVVSEEITIDIDLDEGLNEVQVVAGDGDEVTTVLPLRLWGPEITLANRGSLARPSSHGEGP